MSDNEIDLSFLCELLREAGALALELRRGDFAAGGAGQVASEVKSDHSPVTAVDKAVEALLIKRITRRYPAHLILSEESGLLAHAGPAPEYAWALDPIDGTRAFASGLPIWGVSAGVLRAGQPYAGGFYLPVSGELFWGNREEAWQDQRRLPPRVPSDPHSTLAFVGVPSNFYRHFEVSAPRIRSLGSTAVHLAYVATGASFGMLTRATKLWDLAGVLPLAQATGVELAYLDGHPFEAAELLDGRSVRSGLLAAYPADMEMVKGWVKEK
jgi:fructose-1,6-bisphosphatase/inositol monophosphatase family enzyme